jgi:trigger factor
VHDVKRKTLPELDDAFAREVGDFDSAEALRTAVRDDMVHHAEHEVESDLRQRLMDEVIAANPFEVPRSWVAQLMDNYAQTFNIPQQAREQFDTEFRPVAERQIKRDLIVDAIAKQENLAATESDIDERIAEQAKARNMDVGALYAAMEKAGRLPDIERTITEDKVFQWLKDRNDIVNAS